jgi:hypothetical protein
MLWCSDFGEGMKMKVDMENGYGNGKVMCAVHLTILQPVGFIAANMF